MTRRDLVLSAAAAAAVTGAAWCFDRAIVPERLLLIILPCAVIPPMLALLFRNYGGPRWSVAYVLASSIAGWIVIDLTAGVAFTDIAGLRSGLDGGLSRLFSTTLPVVDQPQALVGVSSLVWLASSVTSWLAASAQRPGLSLLPPSIVAMVGMLASVNGVGRTWVGPVTWVAGSTLLLAAIAAQSRWPSPRLAIGQIAAVAVAVSLVVIATGGLKHRTDAVGIDQQEPPVYDRLLSPLELARVLHQEDFASRTVVSSRSAESTDAIRIATMDEYNGSKWSVRSEFRSTDRRIGGTSEPGVVRSEVTIGEFASAFVPSPSNPVEVRGVEGLRFDAVTATLRSNTGVAPGDTYTVYSSRAMGLDESMLSVSQPASDERGRQALADISIENVSSAGVLDAWIERNAPTTLPPSFRLSAIATYLTDPANRVDERVPSPGASLSSVLAMLALSGDGALVATESQFATLFCVLADSAGFPCRLVVGFRNSNGEVPKGKVEFRGTDVHVWPEVRLETGGQSLGWVAFDSAPKETLSEPDVTTTTAGGTGESGADQDSIPDNPPTSAETPTPPPAAAKNGGTPWWLVAMIGSLLGLAVVASLVPLYRIRQMQRRMSGSATRRVIGSWLLVLDALEAVGESSRVMGSEAVAGRVTAVCGPEVGALCDELSRIVVPVLYGGVDVADDVADHSVALARRCAESILATGTSSQRRRNAFRAPRPREQV